jgi:hypothetical protein
MADQDFLKKKWYVVPNDVIGGWSVTTVDKPVSALMPRAGEFEIVETISKETADHVVALHNWAIGV